MYNFWHYHGVGFLILMLFFPRLTMLFGTVVGGGLLYWVGWLFCPRFTVAVLATILFHDHNMVLIVFAWLAVLLDWQEKQTISTLTKGR